MAFEGAVATMVRIRNQAPPKREGRAIKMATRNSRHLAFVGYFKEDGKKYWVQAMCPIIGQGIPEPNNRQVTSLSWVSHG